MQGVQGCLVLKASALPGCHLANFTNSLGAVTFRIPESFGLVVKY